MNATATEKPKRRKAQANGNGKHDPPHPALTGTTTPAGIAAGTRQHTLADPAAGSADRKEQEDYGGTAPILITWAMCVRHPDNRLPTKEAINQLAASLTAEGRMLERPVVRPLPPGHPHRPAKWSHPSCWQIVAGETRILAARQNGDAGGNAHVLHGCSDRRALELLAVYNAKRKDLNAIEKAKMIQRLCQPVEQGGAGLTREQAAKVYDLESGSAASNLVRLLELPQAWQDRVASGELPWTWARELVPYARLAPLMQELEKEWKNREGATDSYDSAFGSRASLAEELPQLVDDACRRLDEKRYIGGSFQIPKIDAADEQVRKRLGIVEVALPTGKKGQTETVAIATNARAFDELLGKLRGRGAKAAAAQAGSDPAPAKREPPPTPAELKLRAYQQAAQLQKRIDLWRHGWLAHLIGVRIDDNDRLRELLVVWLLVDRPLGYSGNSQLNHPSFRALLTMSDKALYDAGSSYARTVLAIEAASDFPRISAAEINALSAIAKIDLTAEWQALQTPGPQEAEIRLECFFELHQSAQLDSLGGELGVHVEHVSGKAAKIKLLTGCPRTLKLPKSIKPVPKARGQKAGKRSRRSASCARPRPTRSSCT